MKKKEKKAWRLPDTLRHVNSLFLKHILPHKRTDASVCHTSGILQVLYRFLKNVLLIFLIRDSYLPEYLVNRYMSGKLALLFSVLLPSLWGTTIIEKNLLLL